jgi:hypothetical protein
VHAKWGKRRLFGRSKCTSRNARLKLIRQYCHSLQRLLFSLQSLYGSSCGRLNGVELEMRYIDTITARHVSPTIAVHSSTEVHRQSARKIPISRERSTKIRSPRVLYEIVVAEYACPTGPDDNAETLFPLLSLARGAQ